MDEYIVLVNEKNEPIGTAPKLPSHNGDTPLHRGFSLFLFNSKKELLLQQRSHKKKTWPLVWSNSVCGHPMLNESVIDAAKRRLKFELEINNAEIKIVLPNYRYKCEKDGIIENEICPVMVGFTNQEPRLNLEEVENITWISWDEWLKEIKINFPKYSQWCVEETMLLEKSKQFHKVISSK